MSGSAWLRRGLELIGFGLIVWAGWQIAMPLGCALAGLAILNYAFDVGGRSQK